MQENPFKQRIYTNYHYLLWHDEWQGKMISPNRLQLGSTGHTQNNLFQTK